MKDFLFNGIIKSSKRVRSQNRECYGLTRGHKNKFKIYISHKAMEDGTLFAETLLHELLHLYFYFLIACGVKKLSESKQHEILEQIIPVILSRIAIVLTRKNK